jgi:hypothetical protein
MSPLRDGLFLFSSPPWRACPALRGAGVGSISYLNAGSDCFALRSACIAASPLAIEGRSNPHKPDPCKVKSLPFQFHGNRMRSLITLRSIRDDRLSEEALGGKEEICRRQISSFPPVHQKCPVIPSASEEST